MDLRKTFTFDAMQRIVRWKAARSSRRNLAKSPSTTSLTSARNLTAPAAGTSPVYRLTVITPRATIPMAYTYNGQPDAYSTLRAQILAFVKTGST